MVEKKIINKKREKNPFLTVFSPLRIAVLQAKLVCVVPKTLYYYYCIQPNYIKGTHYS